MLHHKEFTLFEYLNGIFSGKLLKSSFLGLHDQLGHGFWASIWFLSITNTGSSCCRTTDPEEALGGGPDHRHQHGFVWQHKLQTSMWLQAVAQIKDMAWPLMVTWITTDSGCSRTSDPDMSPPWQHRPEHHHGPRRQRRPFTTVLLPAAARPINIDIASVSSTVHECSHGSQASSQPRAAAWNTDTNMASGGIMNQGGPSRKYNPEREPFLISGLHHCSVKKILLHTTLLNPTQQCVQLSITALSHARHCQLVPISASPQHTDSSIFLFSTSPLHICSS